MKKYWLLKSEPSTYSIDDLASRPERTDHWDGVRNYQARNFLRDEFRMGDQCFFYHSSCAEPGIVGTMEVVREAYPDPTAFDPDDHHFDPASKKDNPRWYVVDVKLQSKFAKPLLLDELKKQPNLKNMRVLQRGNRLSVTPVSKAEWDLIIKLARK